MKVTPENLIPRPRINAFIANMLITLEKRDPETARKIKAIKSRAKGKKEGKVILISNSARTELTVLASKRIAESLELTIRLMYLKKAGCTINKEVIQEAFKELDTSPKPNKG